MKTRMFIYLIVMLTLATLLSSVGCRGREQATTPPSAQPPAGQPTTQPQPGKVSPTTPAPQAGGQPDLVITEATVTPTNNPNEVRIRIVARNQGGPISAAFTIRWHPHQKDKTQVGCSQDYYDVNQREWVLDNCTYTYPLNLRGEMHWVAVVDAKNDVKNESSENNNEKTGTITVAGGGGQTPVGGGPPQAPASGAYDLYVRRMDFSPADMVVGGTITLHLMIATDTYPSGSPLFPASHFRWRKGPTFAWQEESCPANTQYATCTPNLTFSYTQPGDYVVEVEADSRKAVAESNENNNTKTWTITVKSQTGGQPQLPPAPTNCRARIPTSGAGQIYIDWDFAGQPAPSGFRIYQGKTSLEKTVGASERSVLLSNLTRGVQYHFDVRAYNSAGESRADACALDVTPPR